MRKKVRYNPLQLSLFDDLPDFKGDKETDLDNEFKNLTTFTNNVKTNSDGKQHLPENAERGRERDLLPASERGDGTESSPALEGSSSIQHDERIPAGTLPADEAGRNLSTLPSESNGAVLRTDGQTQDERPDGVRSGGDRVAGISEPRWTNIGKYEGLLNFRHVSTFIRGRDRFSAFDEHPEINYIFGVTLAADKFQANKITRYFQYKENPPAGRFLKDIFDAYKQFLDQPDPLLNDEQMQAMRDAATKVIARVGTEISLSKPAEVAPEKAQNYHVEVTNNPQAKSFSKPAKYRDNIAALDVLIALQKNPRNASADEQNILARYIGWGGLKEILLDPAHDTAWKTESDTNLRSYVAQVYDRYKELDPDGSGGLLLSAKRSILNAHYTSYEVIHAIYHAVEKAGFKGGNILEPAAGIGNFLAAMPVDIANGSDVTAIEMDRVTGMILKRLFPTAETHITGFEKFIAPEDHYDLVVSNVPFGDVAIYDTQLSALKDKRYNEASTNIHNFFFAKAILSAKPGGMIAFITSRYTLDGQMNSSMRELIDSSCQFCGAIRLPDNAFQANAGTQVVSDIIFLKKWGIGEKPTPNEDFLQVKSIPHTDANGTTGIMIYNEYFHNHPSHMLGTVEFGGLYRKDEFNLKGDKEINLYEKITAIADEMFKNPILINHTAKANTEKINAEVERFVAMMQYDTIGNLVTLTGGFKGRISAKFHTDEALDASVRNLGIDPDTIRHREAELTPQEKAKLREAGIDTKDFHYRIVEAVRIKKDDLPKVKYIQSLREGVKELIFKESLNYSDITLENIRTSLKATYNQFVFKYGNLNDKRNKDIIRADIDEYVILSLEIKDKITNRISPAEILSKRTIHPVKEIYQTDNIQDAVLLSLQKYGKLNMNYICELMDKSYEEIMASQRGDETYIFKDEHGGHLSRDAYLSGNVVKKLEIARELAITDPSYENNVQQLEKVQPKPISAVDIYSPLNTRWVPENYLHQFLQELLGTTDFSLSFSPSADTYHLSINNRNAKADAFATKLRSSAWVIRHALNGIEPRVTYTEELPDGTKVEKLDPEDTQLAKENYRKIREGWDDWKFKDFNRREHLASIYNKTYNTSVLRRYDGSKLNFPGLVGFNLRSHQKDAVFRNIQQLGGINDHKVGAGKTLVEVATAMELRRLGMATKPMIIGLKSQVPQLYEQFKKAYPLAKVLFPSEKDFEKSSRKQLLSNIATNDWDAIILSHDQFGKIQQPVDVQVSLISELTEVIKEEISATDDKREKKQLEKRLYKYEQKIEALTDSAKDKDVLDFAQLGVDFLMLDESQEFKNLEFLTTKKNVRGLGNPLGSKRAFNMLVAARYLQHYHCGDKGILFSSGTPISNTMAELYLLFKYLRPQKMQEMGLTSFDRWAANFANDYTDLEYYMGRFKEVNRFREFVNLPELLTLYREIADVRNDANLTLDKPTAEHTLIKIGPSETQLQLIEKLQKFINSKGNDYASELGLTAGYDNKRRMNPSFAIMAINFAKKLSMDPRLIDHSYEAGTKIEKAAENIANIYNKYASFKGTQLVFCDIGTPKGKSITDNIYEHLSDNVSQADLEAIFGTDYYEKKTKPRIEDIKAKIGVVLSLSEAEVGDLITEANTQENFNVYSELKYQLTQKGIPEHQIAFIHDYNTRLQKEELFEAVNKGDMRVVLGSTKKLGTGVNVQTRCVAGHHLDISWRPADIEQRNGRFERQGNEVAKNFLDNKVTAYYYATERTLDASMYNTVSQKAKFIAQLKVTDTVNAQRTAKDIEEEIDMGSMAAELSGDPIFKEKATLQKRVDELKQLEKSFNSKKYDFEDKCKNSQKLVLFYQEQIINLEKNIPLIRGIPKDEKGEFLLKATLAGRSFDKISDYGTAIIAEAEHAKKYKPVGQKFSLGELWGFKVTGKVEHDFIENRNIVERQIISPLGDTIGPVKRIADGVLAAALQIKQSILEMPKELDRVKERFEIEKQNITEYAKKAGEEFPYKEELDGKQQRLHYINNEIIKITKQDAERDNQRGENIAEREVGYGAVKMRI